MAAEEWTHIRVRKSTKAAIDKFIVELDRLMEVDPDAAELGRWDKITADQAIRVLLNRVNRHRARAKKARAKGE